MTSPEPADADRPIATDFVRELVQRDIEEGRFGGRVQTRFPPEPNGYLHIGHAKAITLDYELAADFGGTCNLRFDDTNPDTEEASYVEGIIADLRWLVYEPGEPLYKDIYGLSPEELKDVPKMPGSLEEALGELKKDHQFLLKGDVFTEDVIDAWIENKIERELNPVRLRPTPTEFALYFDI